ncbi:hypothetical protein D3C78_276900 [compost metagenome]
MFWAAFAALFAWIADATPTNIMAAGAYSFAACCILMPVSFAWSWVVRNVQHFAEAFAALLVGALLWAHVWLLAYVLMGLEFGLYSMPNIAGWLLVSLWLFMRRVR